MMPSLNKSKVKSSWWDLPVGLTVAFLALVLLLGPAGAAQASTVSIKLTSDALGLGTSRLNYEKTVDADVLDAFWTSGAPGEGSILQIQTDGKAGDGTIDINNPLFVTVTARQHLDVLDLATHQDYYAGIITLSGRDH